MQKVFTNSEERRSPVLNFVKFQRQAHYRSLRCACSLCQKIRSLYLPLKKQFTGLFCSAEFYHEFFRNKLLFFINSTQSIDISVRQVCIICKIVFIHYIIISAAVTAYSKSMTCFMQNNRINLCISEHSV